MRDSLIAAVHFRSPLFPTITHGPFRGVQRAARIYRERARTCFQGNAQGIAPVILSNAKDLLWLRRYLGVVLDPSFHSGCRLARNSLPRGAVETRDRDDEQLADTLALPWRLGGLRFD